MQINDVKRESQRKHKRQVGRGGKRGKTSGRGTKGQKARAGRKIRPEIRDMIKRIPKLRGRGKNSFKSFQIKPFTVSLGLIDAHFSAGETVSVDSLISKKILSLYKGKKPAVKILDGDLTKKITIAADCSYSKAVSQKVTKLGGNLLS